MASTIRDDAGAGQQGSGRGTINFYYNASQLRFDTWQTAKSLSAQIASAAARMRDVEPLRAKLKSSLSILQTIEDYTAFPSKEDFRLLWRPVIFELECIIHVLCFSWHGIRERKDAVDQLSDLGQELQWVGLVA